MRIQRLTPEQLTHEQRELYDAIAGGPRAAGPQRFALTADDGSLNGPFNGFLLAPAVGDALQGVGAAIRYRTALGDRARELAILLVAARWNSAFERHAHEAIATGLGFDEATLDAVRREDLAPFDGTERAVGDATLALLDGDLDDDAYEAALASLGEAAIFELTTLVGYYSTLALQLRVFRVDEAPLATSTPRPPRA
ncbi:4-carboxymuconolactone decarboxylase [Pseudoclavibacter endophyticus]|uniref:Carboxymuconolactone decarboxylase family protein n=1 Tax=Pseudoclavibacter endophyticus TaxID=1778590 RepID=A0A6H9WF13_9MICO|nr:carboxymuconolactone decarboxylase family protein [Pseudoclavibacter endophyticus]KAB1649519.1 carboxymuconolactone decarboxylase family protein [Pseudoclavibacter endophyticus]GGA61954.1 4-carboxymuconolactone decarboxylase [Pseudoclavibacter endophyticus]